MYDQSQPRSRQCVELHNELLIVCLVETQKLEQTHLVKSLKHTWEKITTRTNVLKIHTAMRSHLVLLDLQNLIKSVTLKLVPELPINTIITAMNIRILIANLSILSL